MKKQIISVLSILMMMFQSCVVYQSTSTPINKASEKGKVKITSTLEDKLKFNNIYLKDGIYYGVHKNVETQIDTTQISTIYLKDKKKSKTRTIILIVASPFIVFFLFFTRH